MEEILKDKAHRYKVEYLYNKHWYAILPSVTIYTVFYLYSYCELKKMHFSIVRQFLLESGIDEKLESLKTESSLEVIVEDYLKTHNMVYPVKFDDHIRLIEKFGIISIKNDRVIFNKNLKLLEDTLLDLPAEIMQDIANYDREKNMAELLVNYCRSMYFKIKDSQNDEITFKVSLLDFAKEYNFSMQDLSYTITYIVNMLEINAVSKNEQGNYLIDVTKFF